MNVPTVIATLVSHKMAALHELDTVYGVQDAYDMIEIIAIDMHNEALVRPE